MTINYCYNDQAKTIVNTNYRKLLKQVAEELGLTKDQYDLRVNPGGIAVWGEVTLHTDNLYIQASHGCSLGVLVRTCNGRRDFTGGYNRYIPVSRLLDSSKQFARDARAITERFTY
jgi:hypothetical protein